MKHQKGTPWTIEKIKFFLIKSKSPYSPLFSNYLGQHHKHSWRCSKCGDKFKSSWKVMWNTVRGIRKGGCLRCAKRLNYTINQVHQELKDSNRPIKCLSKTYENNKKPMIWKCLNSGCVNEWKATWKAIKGVGVSKGQGCIVCSNNVKYTIETIKKVIEKKQLPMELLSNKYEHNQVPLKWKCKECSQAWMASWSSINNSNRGCPFCSTCGKTEEKIGKFLNKLYDNHEFVKVRPDFMKYPKSGRNLEIDLYCKSLNLAIEVNGDLHYNYNKYFHKNINRFQETVRKDKWKKKRLKQLTINFIVIPIQGKSPIKIKEFIRLELERLGYEIPKKFNELNIL